MAYFLISEKKKKPIHNFQRAYASLDVDWLLRYIISVTIELFIHSKAAFIANA